MKRMITAEDFMQRVYDSASGFDDRDLVETITDTLRAREVAFKILGDAYEQLTPEQDYDESIHKANGDAYHVLAGGDIPRNKETEG